MPRDIQAKNGEQRLTRINFSVEAPARNSWISKSGNRQIKKLHPSHTEEAFDCAQDKWGTQRRGLNASEASEVVLFRHFVVKKQPKRRGWATRHRSRVP